jgi:hypothetical protein
MMRIAPVRVKTGGEQITCDSEYTASASRDVQKQTVFVGVTQLQQAFALQI